MKFKAVSLLRWAGIVLYHLGAARAVIWWNRRFPKVLLYHACEATESDFTRDLDSNTTPAEFSRHLDFLARHYRVVELAALHGGVIPDRAVVITFDDGYRSVFTNALPLLEARGYAATVFLVSDVIDNEAMVWVNELNWLLRNHGGVARRVLHDRFGIDESSTPVEAITEVRFRRRPAEISAALAEIRALARVDERALRRQARLYVSWDEIATMRRRGIGFGNHTATHPSLARLGAEEQAAEMQRAQHQLAERLGPMTALAYPFGDMNAESQPVATALGFSCMAEVGGINDPLDLHRLRRTPIAGGSTARLFSELEVVGPIKGRIARWVQRIDRRLRGEDSRVRIHSSASNQV